MSNKKFSYENLFSDDARDLRVTVEGRLRQLETFLNTYIPTYNTTDTGLWVKAGIVVPGDLQHTGSKVGFYGTAPTVQSAAYTPTNVVVDRSYDADATTTAELADVVGTLIADLQLTGLLG